MFVVRVIDRNSGVTFYVGDWANFSAAQEMAEIIELAIDGPALIFRPNPSGELVRVDPVFSFGGDA